MQNDFNPAAWSTARWDKAKAQRERLILASNGGDEDARGNGGTILQRDGTFAMHDPRAQERAETWLKKNGVGAA